MMSPASVRARDAALETPKNAFHSRTLSCPGTSQDCSPTRSIRVPSSSGPSSETRSTSWSARSLSVTSPTTVPCSSTHSAMVRSVARNCSSSPSRVACSGTTCTGVIASRRARPSSTRVASTTPRTRPSIPPSNTGKCVRPCSTLSARISSGDASASIHAKSTRGRMISPTRRLESVTIDESRSCSVRSITPSRAPISRSTPISSALTPRSGAGPGATSRVVGRMNQVSSSAIRGRRGPRNASWSGASTRRHAPGASTAASLATTSPIRMIAKTDPTEIPMRHTAPSARRVSTLETMKYATLMLMLSRRTWSRRRRGVARSRSTMAPSTGCSSRSSARRACPIPKKAVSDADASPEHTRSTPSTTSMGTALASIVTGGTPPACPPGSRRVARSVWIGGLRTRARRECTGAGAPIWPDVGARS